jgi:hypothetical protein
MKMHLSLLGKRVGFALVAVALILSLTPAFSNKAEAIAHTLTVVGGTGSGSHSLSDVVPIVYTPVAGQKFSGWTTSAGGTFANASNASTNFTMPDADVTVTANHVVASTADDITVFSFAGLTGGTITGTITGTNIAVTIPSCDGAVTALVPTITVSNLATVSPLSGVAHNFTTPATYTVTAEDGVTTKAYTVTVTVADPIATAFASVSSGLTGITNNLYTVNSCNYTSFSGAFFDKTGLGRITFTGSLDLSATATRTFLQGLDSHMTMSAGVVGLDPTTAAALAAAGAEIKMYGFPNISTSNLVFTGVDDSSNPIAANTLATIKSGATIGNCVDASCTLTFDVTHFSTYHVYDPTASVAADKAALVDSLIKGSNADLSHITVALANPLPSTGTYGSTITWASDATSIVSSDGQTVNRPTNSAGDATVHMTATIAKTGATSDTKVFTLTVKARSNIATVTSTAYTVGASTITNVSAGTSKLSFISNVTKGESHQTWSETNLSSVIANGDILGVTSEDGTATKQYTISVVSAGVGLPAASTSVSATDKSLVVKPTQSGTLTQSLSGGQSVKIEIPKGSISSNATFNIQEGSLSADETPQSQYGAFLFDGLVFNINAADSSGTAVKSFNKDLTITLTVPSLPADTSGLKLYYYDETNKTWVAITGVVFGSNTITFTVNHLTKFAVFSTNANDESSTIADGDIIQCKSSADPNAVYIVKLVNGKKYIRHIVSLTIFNHYKHLKWENLKQVGSLAPYAMSGWVRVSTGKDGAPSAGDKVYEINGDQSKHWIDMTAQQFLAHGGSNEAIFSVNEGEMDLYKNGAAVMSL